MTAVRSTGRAAGSLAALVAGGLLVLASPAPAAEPEIAVDGALLAGHGALHLQLTLPEGAAGDVPTGAVPTSAMPVTVRIDGRPVDVRELEPGAHELTLSVGGISAGRHTIEVEADGSSASLEVRAIPGWLSLVPPLLAIGLALAFKDVILSLFLGIFGGALILTSWSPVSAFARSIDSYVLPALADADHAAIIIFSTLLGGMVGVIGRSGGSHGIVERLAPYATNSRRGQLATWAMGVLVFFDDYANTLIVGSTMRPISDRLRISREKLAYIVDSTAAPVASVVPISTWIGFEVGLIQGAFDQLGLDLNAYNTFIASIAYRFYPIFALVMGFAVAFFARDFGPMRRAELRAAASGDVVGEGQSPLADFGGEALTPPEGTPRRSRNALLPILTVIAVTLVGLVVNGSAGLDPSSYEGTFGWLQASVSNANSFHVLLWASLAGLTVAIALSVAQRILSVKDALEAALAGFRSMLMAIVVLILAWSIGEVCASLHTADYLVALTEGSLAPHWLPVLTFVISALVAFATGTSWATMAILIPLVIPITHGLALAAGHGVDSRTFYVLIVGTVSSVLAGSVWGDHCSPISDTTILSSMASGCDHIAHVRTQMPYAIGLGVLGMAVGDIPTAFGLSPWISLAVGAVVIVAAVRWLGKPSTVPDPSA